MKIKKKKMFKSKYLFFFLIFQRKKGDLLCRWKNTNILPQIFISNEKCDFFVDFGQKNGKAGLIMLKLSTKRNQVFLKKKT